MCRQDDLYTPGMPIRRLLIKAAYLDVKRYFRRPGEIVMHEGEEHRSELDWLLNFDNGHIRDADCCYFLLIYRRRLDSRWKLASLANLARSWACYNREFAIDVFLARLAELQECRTDSSNERSIVTKLSFFANPRQAVFICDRFARLALGYRHPLRGAPRGYDSSAIGAYLRAAREALTCERNRCDFQRAVRAVIPMLDPVQNTVFRGDKAALDRFAERRLLDKLMYYEGRLLDSDRTDPSGEAAQVKVSVWIKGLENDLLAADEANGHLDAAD